MRQMTALHERVAIVQRGRSNYVVPFDFGA